jgi:quercetin dioxygenase-like cupin family protein
MPWDAGYKATDRTIHEETRAMSIAHAISGEPIDVAPFDSRLREQRSAALFKSEQLEVMRLVLPAGKSIPEHKVSGEITIQCIEGELSVRVDGNSTRLLAGQLMFLLGSVPHSVTAVVHSSALVTLVLPH